MKLLLNYVKVLLIAALSCAASQATPTEPMRAVHVYCDVDEDAISFAVDDLIDLLAEKNINTTLKPLNALPTQPEGHYMVIAERCDAVERRLAAAKGRQVGNQFEQLFGRIEREADGAGREP